VRVLFVNFVDVFLFSQPMAPFMWSFDGKYFAKLNEDAIQVLSYTE
jgi:hypothetical protein